MERRRKLSTTKKRASTKRYIVVGNAHSKIPKVLVDLNSEDGNTFYLLALAKKYAGQLGLNYNVLYKELTAGDYDNLIVVFNKYFSEFVLLYY